MIWAERRNDCGDLSTIRANFKQGTLNIWNEHVLLSEFLHNPRFKRWISVDNDDLWIFLRKDFGVALAH